MNKKQEELLNEQEDKDVMSHRPPHGEDGHRPPPPHGEDGHRPPPPHGEDGHKPPPPHDEDGHRPPPPHGEDGHKPPHGGRPPHGEDGHKPPHCGRPPHGEDGHKPPHGGRPPHEEDGEERPISKYAKPQGEGGPPGGMRGGPGMGGPGMMGGKQERAKLKDTKSTIKRVYSYIKGQKIALIFALICVILNTIFNLVASYMIRPIVNGVLENNGVEGIFTDLIFMLTVYLLAFITNYTQSRIMLEISEKSMEKIRSDLFEKLQKLPLKYYDVNTTGDIMSRFSNDVGSLSQMMSSTLVGVISGVITLVGTLGLMLYTNWLLTIITLIMIPLFTFVGKFISTKSRKYYKQQQEILGELNGYIEETISGQKIVKVFSHEKDCMEEFNGINKKYRNTVLYAQFLGSVMGPVMGVLGQLNYSLTAFIGGLLCIYQGFDIGGFTVFVNYSRSFTRPITDLSNQVNTIFSALAGAERVFEVLDEETEVEDVEKAVTLDNMQGSISVEGVDFSYIPEKLVLKNICFEAKKGEKIAFVGSTGAGKTTITNLLNRFYDIPKGTIKIDGVDINSMKKSYLRENIATVLQDTHLFSGTVMENIRYGRLDATDEEVIEIAKVANAHHFIERLENGYDTMLENDGANLSQGQRQLLNIARASISKAPILVLDEATSSVDTRTEKLIEVALDKLMETRTTLVIAHRLSTVRNSDAIMVLEHGEIIERGTHDELLEMQGRYYSLSTGLTKLT